MVRHRYRPRSGTAPDEGLARRLYDEFGGALLAHTLRLTGNDRQWAEDVVQETMVRAWRNAEKLNQEPALLRAWLFTVARRVIIDDRRSRSARPRESELTETDVIRVQDSAEQALSAIVLTDALNTLSDEHREAVRETYLRGRTVREAAEILGIPPGTVKSRVYYALRALRRVIQDRG